MKHFLFSVFVVPFHYMYPLLSHISSHFLSSCMLNLCSIHKNIIFRIHRQFCSYAHSNEHYRGARLTKLTWDKLFKLLKFLSPNDNLMQATPRCSLLSLRPRSMSCMIKQKRKVHFFLPWLCGMKQGLCDPGDHLFFMLLSHVFAIEWEWAHWGSLLGKSLYNADIASNVSSLT